MQTYALPQLRQALDDRKVEDPYLDDIAKSGLAAYTDQGAQVQKVSGAEMSASFIMVTNKGPNRNGARIQLTANKQGKGLVLDQYAQNPVNLFNHGNGSLDIPVGLAVDPKTGQLAVKVTKSKAVGTVFFEASSRIEQETLGTSRIEQVFRLVEAKIIRAASIMIMLEEYEFVDDEENDQFFVDVFQSDLMEFGPVTIGADPHALRQCIESGKYKDVSAWLEPDAAVRLAQSTGVEFDLMTSDILDDRLLQIEQSQAKILEKLDRPITLEVDGEVVPEETGASATFKLSPEQTGMGLGIERNKKVFDVVEDRLKGYLPD